MTWKHWSVLWTGLIVVPLLWLSEWILVAIGACAVWLFVSWLCFFACFDD